VARDEHHMLVQEALSALSPEHRSVVVLRYTHGLKLREIADALSCTTRTARNRLRAAAVLLERELRRRGVVSEEGIE
jgi:RNA polymerase sigma factor (sigma-70 family)